MAPQLWPVIRDRRFRMIWLHDLIAGVGLPTPDQSFLNLVGLGRLELPTSRLSSARSNQLSYKPGSRGPTDRPPGIRMIEHDDQTSRRCGGTGLVREERET